MGTKSLLLFFRGGGGSAYTGMLLNCQQAYWKAKSKSNIQEFKIPDPKIFTS